MKKGLDLIYVPSGRAREYSPLAANLYIGCPHGCLYCYGPSIPPRKKKEVFHSVIHPKKNVIERLQKDAETLRAMRDSREILLSFVTDPYMPVELELGVTRRAINILVDHQLAFTVLTKGGMRAARDFDLLKYPHARFGTTLVLWDQAKADIWEPNAPSIKDRIQAIEKAHSLGIKTWVSLEPVIYPEQAMRIIQELHPIVDHWKIGKLNHRKPPEPVDWIEFRLKAQALLDSVGADYYFKNSLPLLTLNT